MALAHRVFEELASATPSAVAVTCEGVAVTYRELDRRANGVARALANVQRDEPVGLYVDRSIEMIAGFLGILKAGGAMLPLDPSYPRARLALMIADARVRTILAAGEGPDASGCALIDLRVAPAETAPAVDVSPDHLAYVIYTSGSTGRPKGVMVPHRGLVNLARVHARPCRITPASRVLQFASFSFDGFVWEVVTALLGGASLVIAPRERIRPGAELLETLREHRVTTVALPPSVLAVLSPSELPALETVVSAGEALSSELHAAWSATHHVVNSYGPTELTVCATLADEVVRDGRISIGDAIAGARTYVLDEQLVAAEQGELYVSSLGLARGYLGRAALTAERFVPDLFSPVPGARMYRTGDVVRVLPSGALEFVGRADGQVKVRGYRIELGEIEHVIREQRGVRDVAVAVHEDRNTQRTLLAFVIVGPEVTASAVHAALAARLPEYAVPTVVAVARFPLTPNNKVDRAALLRDHEAALRMTGGTAPRSAAERLVAKAWSDILGFEAGDVDANFFAIGGSSLKAAMVADTLQDLLEETVYVGVLFDHPTIARLTAHLAATYAEAIARVTGEEVTPAPQAVATMTPSHVAELRALIERVVTAPAPVARPIVRNPRAVFLLSAPRAGSTLVRVMLAGHPELYVPQELGLLGFERLGEHARVATGHAWLSEGLVRALMDLEGWTVDEAKAHLAAHERDRTTTHELYRALQARIGPRLLVDKSTTYALDANVLRRAERTFEEPFYIHLVRHPCGMVRSFEHARMDQLFFGGHDLRPRQLGELIWCLCTENLLAFLRDIPAARRCVLRYEDVVRDPAGQMRALCERLGLAYDAGMIEPYRDGPHKMLDGIHEDPASRQVGDVHFLEHRGIDASVANAWHGLISLDAFGDMTRELASSLGYAHT